MNTLAREGSKMSQALTIYQDNLGDTNHIQICLELFQKHLGQKPSTAATYFNLCVQKLDSAQQTVTNQVIESTRKNKFSSVKLKRGTNQASRVHCFFTKKAAQQFNEQHGYHEVVKGVQEPGKPLGTVKVA